MIFKIYTDTSIFIKSGHEMQGKNSDISICFYSKNYKLFFCEFSKANEYI